MVESSSLVGPPSYAWSGIPPDDGDASRLTVSKYGKAKSRSEQVRLESGGMKELRLGATAEEVFGLDILADGGMKMEPERLSRSWSTGSRTRNAWSGASVGSGGTLSRDVSREKLLR